MSQFTGFAGMVGAHGAVVVAGLMLMSLSSGCMDVLSYRFLGDVFTSAMTGNIALLGLDLGRGDVLAALRNMTAFASFLFGLAAGAAVLRRRTRGALLRALGLELALLGGFAALWGIRGPEPATYALIGLSAVAMGMQSAAAHRIGVPGVTTTYFTGTLTDIVFGLVGGRREKASPNVGPPILAFLSYIGGAAGAGWYTSGRGAPDAAQWLPALPAGSVLLLLVAVALARSPPKQS